MDANSEHVSDFCMHIQANLIILRAIIISLIKRLWYNDCRTTCDDTLNNCIIILQLFMYNILIDVGTLASVGQSKDTEGNLTSKYK